MKKLKYLDYFIFVPFIILCAIGIVMVYSSSSNIAVQSGGTPLGYLKRQSTFVIIGLGLAYVVYRLNLERFRKAKTLFSIWVVFMVVLLGLLFFGKTVNGAAGWISFGSFSIQPAEFSKYFLIFLNAYYVANARRQSEMHLSVKNWWDELKAPMILSMLQILLILLQPDLGGAVINFAAIAVIWLASGMGIKKSASWLIGSLIAVYFILLPLAGILANSGIVKSYKLQRIIAFENPFAHAQTVGQQLVNSYYALSNGGLFGVGLGRSIQKTGYLPEPNTDFIIAITAEELGLLFCLALILLLMVIIGRAVLIGIRSKNNFYSLLCYGIATYLSVQTFFNLGGVLGMLPITGVTFPFVSYGGSSMITASVAIGTLLNISAKEKYNRE
ncbi:FtsW/RodA/SpoVE family cell cycle protein [Secundilactobacillus malefermentans]|uniref:Probable peptidoglycan glycosyltransferase FtsW n=1 Tax=Secundilactobacillus malefermentans TaxID=176292 RepID=A0A4R5NKH2_9LACO|nr:FtsW/RodA/SpoVE family cell cycle protein [Secundilactobacillus malefermentans]KRM60055.1 cell division protein FtsW [Secundilactobacillus malefermentans DSM 5705 = KCTC 3548]QEA30830.1 FtsW/RodA/SpoVE family cell cycle protein [Secundilactobacillus malefermentans]TDG75143.1 hypothetical protein C5L31_001020 [Secundilactobacillus malefermentans]